MNQGINNQSLCPDRSAPTISRTEPEKRAHPIPYLRRNEVWWVNTLETIRGTREWRSHTGPSCSRNVWSQIESGWTRSRRTHETVNCSFVCFAWQQIDCGLRIHANGGTCAQIAKPDMLVVYGGTVTREWVYQRLPWSDSKLTAPIMNFFIRHSLM